METSYFNKKRGTFGFMLLFFFAIGLTLSSCAKDDDLEDVDEEASRQDAVIAFEPEFFGQSFQSAPDSTHYFVVKVNKGQKAATAFAVYEKVMSEGVLVQERTELTSYRRQLADSDTEEINVEYHVSEERLNNDKITLDFVVEQEDDSVSEALVIEVEQPEPEEDPVQEINDIIYYTQLALGGQDNAETGSFFDVEGATEFNLPEATANQADVDFAMLVGGSTGINFLAPGSSGFQYFGSELEDAVYDGWDVKNNGEFVNIGNLGDSEELFEGLDNAAAIVQAFEEARAGVTNIPGYVANENGPGDRVRQVNVGDIIFFKSEAGTIAVLKIESMLPDTAGVVEFRMKTAAEPGAGTEEPEEPEVPGDLGDDMVFYNDVELGGQNNENVGGFFAVAEEAIYNLDEATQNQEKVSFGMLVGASTGVNFLVPSSSGFQYFGADTVEETVFGWDTRNTGTFINIGSSGELGEFEDINTQEELTAAFQAAEAGIEDLTGYVENENGPGDRIRKMNIGDVIFFQAEDGSLSVMKIEELIGGSSGSVTFDVKTGK